MHRFVLREPVYVLKDVAGAAIGHGDGRGELVGAGVAEEEERLVAVSGELVDELADGAAAALLDGLSQVGVFDPTHELEHSLEVHLPFLQVVLGEFKLLPLIVGETPPGPVAQVLDALWGGPETLIVVSTDLSHYLDYDAAQALDIRAAAIRAVGRIEPQSLDRLLEMAKNEDEYILRYLASQSFANGKATPTKVKEFLELLRPPLQGKPALQEEAEDAGW